MELPQPRKFHGLRSVN